MNYSFDIDVANEYGVNQAIMIRNFQFWIMKNKADGKNFYDGNWWTYSSTKAFVELFPFWTQKQIELILKRLVDVGVIKKGNYNHSSYDRTCWYAFVDEDKWIFENSKIHFTKKGNGNDEMGEPIPDNNIDNKENKNINILVKESPLPDGQPTTSPFDRFVDWWNGELIPVEDNTNGNVVKIQVRSQKRKQMFKARWNDTKVYMRNQGMDVDDESVFVYMTEEVIGGNYVNSDWMRGKVKGNGYETGYRVEFDNIFTPKMWTGLLEKKYYNRSLDKVKYGS